MGFLNYDFFQMTKNLHSRYSCTTAKGMIIMNIPSLRHTILFGRNELTCNTKDDCVMHHAVVLPNSLNVMSSVSLPLLRQKYRANSENLCQNGRMVPSVQTRDSCSPCHRVQLPVSNKPQISLEKRKRTRKYYTFLENSPSL